MTAWILLTLAILAEVCGTVALRLTEGFTRPVPGAIVVVGYGLSFYLLSLVLKQLPLSLIYAVWSGAGTALVAIVGVVALSEGLSTLKVFGIALVIAGIVSLNLSGAH